MRAPHGPAGAPLHYLLKPVKPLELEQALHDAKRAGHAEVEALIGQAAGMQPDCITAHTHEGDSLIPVDDIICFHAQDKYTTVYHGGGQSLISDSLNALEQRFPDVFVRIHRNALVATRLIVDCCPDDDGGWQVRLYHCQTPLPVSRRRLAAVRDSIDNELLETLNAETSYRHAPEQAGDVAGGICAEPSAGCAARSRCNFIADPHQG